MSIGPWKKETKERKARERESARRKAGHKPGEQQAGPPRRAGGQNPSMPNGPEIAPASVVTGAESEADLQAQAAAAELGISAPRGRSASTLRKREQLMMDAAELKKKRETMLNLCRMIAPIPYEAVAQLSGEPKWASYLAKPIDSSSTQTRADMIAEAYAKVCEAWGFDFTGKYTALSIVLAANARVAAAIYAEIKAESPAEPQPVELPPTPVPPVQ
jgi:hypothetical protein